jgi:DNA repair protein RecN (Recombination protein N)
MLAQALGTLAEIHGQHEHQRLLHRESHLDLLDRAADLLELRGRLAEAVERWRGFDRERESLRVSEEDRLRQIDYLRFQIREILEVDPEPGEDERLGAERARLTHAVRLAEAAGGAEAALYSGEGAVVEGLGRTAAALREAGRLDASVRPVAERVESALRECEDIAATLRDYAGGIVFDPERLAEVEGRLETLRRLLRKYGPGIDAVRGALDAAQARLAGLEARDERFAGLEAECEAAREAGAALAEELSAARRRAARVLGRKVQKELEALGLGKAAFHVGVSPETLPPPGFGERGLDRIEFGFAPNPGEPPRPLARIASGGELARTMLAIQNVLAGNDLPATLVFDEADAGVSGRIADAVGQRLSDLAGRHQVICLTHMPQIAARGGRHLRVRKEIVGGRTVARLEPVEQDARVEEIARMSGGAQVSATTRAHARELLKAPGRTPPTPKRRR